MENDSAFTPLAEQGVIQLREHETRSAPAADLSAELGEAIWKQYSKEVSIDFPSPRTGQRWRLTAGGSVGYLPLGEGVGISLQPKVELDNLFRMLEWAHSANFRVLDGVMGCQSLEEFFARIANILAKRVSDRARRGLYRKYVACAETLPYVRGSLDMRRIATRPWEVRLHCRFDEHIADVQDNQILAWALYRASRNAACTGEARANVRQAFKVLRGVVGVAPVRVNDCLGRSYDRLNADYAPMHALCRFILESSGPTHDLGGHAMLPFVIDMPNLFERFVGEWLRAHLPRGLKVRTQNTIWRSETCGATFVPDLLLLNSQSGEPVAVLDTKYKAPNQGPAASDIEQVVAYSTALRCRDAYLIYPRELNRPLEDRVGDVMVRSATFSLAGDLDVAGAGLLDQLRLVGAVGQ